MEDVADIIRSSQELAARMLADTDFCARVRRAGDGLVNTYRAGGRVYACGNGGSAAHAQHFTAELTGRFLLDRPPLAAEALISNPSHLSAVANDYSFDEVFSRAVEASIKPSDSLVVLTTSGRSRNVVRAAEMSRSAGATVVALTGAEYGEFEALADVVLDVPSRETPRIQEAHLLLIHALAAHIEHEIFG